MPAAPAAGPDRYEPWLRRRLRRHRRCEWPPEPPSVEGDTLRSAAVRCSAGRLPAASPWRDDGGILYHIAERRHRLRHREWAHTQVDAAARRLRPRPAEEVPQAGAASMVRAGPSGRTGGFAAAARRRERGCAVQRAMASAACRRSWAACSVACRRAAMDWVRAVACPSSWESVSSSGRTSQRCSSCRYCCWAVDRAAWASSYWRRAAWRSSCCHWASCCCSSSNWCWASCSRSCAASNCSAGSPAGPAHPPAGRFPAPVPGSVRWSGWLAGRSAAFQPLVALR